MKIMRGNVRIDIARINVNFDIVWHNVKINIHLQCRFEQFHRILRLFLDKI